MHAALVGNGPANYRRFICGLLWSLGLETYMRGDGQVRSPTIAIVGAAGFIGQSLARAAEGQGWQTVRIIRGRRQFEGSVRATPDLERESDLGDLLQGADICVNLAARVHITNSGPESKEVAAHCRMNTEFRSG